MYDSGEEDPAVIQTELRSIANFLNTRAERNLRLTIITSGNAQRQSTFLHQFIGYFLPPEFLFWQRSLCCLRKKLMTPSQFGIEQLGGTC